MSYIIQTIAFQLLFLVIYDFFLKKETFFNWNRAYLLVTPLLSLILPFIKLERFKTTMPQDYVFLLPEVTVSTISTQQTTTTISQTIIPNWNIWQWIFTIGCILSFIWFIYKLSILFILKRKGKINRYKEYTQIEVPTESTAFSFFKNIFIGSSLLQKEHRHIIAHELIHIKEKHSWDLVFFEILRIVFWFNPLVYIFQKRITELHEFIADAKTVKHHKKEHFQSMLQEVFQTENFSFVNQFFNHSLIKKRIVMLQKSKSKKVWQLKYLLLIPLVIGMLFYTSCEKEENVINEKQLSIEEQIKELEISLESNKEALTPELKNRILLLTNSDYIKEKYEKESIDNKNTDTPFTEITKKPRFTACDNVPEKEQFDCFKKMLDEHIIKTFKYPEEAIKNEEEGRVYVLFRINEDGTVTITNSRAPSPSLDAEGRRIIESLPTLIPGKDASGTPKPVTFAYPISFKLNTAIKK